MYAKSSGAFSAYKETKVKTASQTRLIVMLYDGAMRQINGAVEMIRANKGPSSYSDINTALNKAQNIISELAASLDFEQGGEIAKSLYGLYVFFNREIVDANLKKEEGNLMEINNLLLTLRDAWDAVDVQRDAPERGAINIAG